MDTVLILGIIDIAFKSAIAILLGVNVKIARDVRSSTQDKNLKMSWDKFNIKEVHNKSAEVEITNFQLDGDIEKKEMKAQDKFNMGGENTGTQIAKVFEKVTNLLNKSLTTREINNVNRLFSDFDNKNAQQKVKIQKIIKNISKLSDENRNEFFERLNNLSENEMFYFNKLLLTLPKKEVSNFMSSLSKYDTDLLRKFDMYYYQNISSSLTEANKTQLKKELVDKSSNYKNDNSDNNVSIIGEQHEKDSDNMIIVED